MLQKINLTMFILLGQLLALSAMAEVADPTMLTNTCSGCHGTNGQSVGLAIPTIAGLNAEYSLKIMQDYRDGKAVSTIMGRLMKGYTDAELEKMATYFATLPFIGAIQSYDPAKAQQGAQLHQDHCETCHSDNGKESSYGGILAGQWMPYLTSTMADFAAGKRDMPKVMQKKLRLLDAQSIDALINFYGSQK